MSVMLSQSCISSNFPHASRQLRASLATSVSSAGMVGVVSTNAGIVNESGRTLGYIILRSPLERDQSALA